MAYVLALVGTAGIALLAAHLWLRKDYGINPVRWARIEIAWWALSFLSATLAAAQFEDKISASAKERVDRTLLRDWNDVRGEIPALRRGLESEAVQQEYLSSYGPAVYADFQKRLRRFANSVESKNEADLVPSNAYDGYMDAFCAHLIGGFTFSGADYLRFYGSVVTDNSGSETQDYAELSAITCSNLYAVKVALAGNDAITSERHGLEPFYAVARYWYFMLIVGFALKFTKNTSDLVKARREAARLASATPPGTPAAGQPS